MTITPCLCVYMYICIHLIHTYIYRYVYICIYIYIYIYVYTCIYIYVYTYQIKREAALQEEQAYGSVLKCVVMQWVSPPMSLASLSITYSGAGYCNVLQCVAVCCSMVLDFTHEYSCCNKCTPLFRCHSLCSVLQCVAACCRVLKCVAECCNKFRFSLYYVQCCRALKCVAESD